jgi:hypothetical protein
VGGGTITAQGGVTYRPNLVFDLGLSARDVRMLYPQGMRESIYANLRLAGTTENAVLGGAVNLADISFTPAFDLTNFISQVSGGTSPPPSQGLENAPYLCGIERSTEVDPSLAQKAKAAFQWCESASTVSDRPWTSWLGKAAACCRPAANAPR